ncbi:MAG: hypothetical protein M3340_17240 [Actinomycetota bacterium]|nr:hypothetical protein [Actinomycetota bacterium]
MRRLRLDRFELVTLAALFALSVAVLAGLLVRVWSRGGVVTGSDGFLVVDQLQYLNWLRQSGEHGLVGNLYDLEPGPRTFLHPGVLISGVLHRIGLGVVAAYVVWKPVAVAALFAAALLWTRRFLDRRGDRRLALALVLFTASPVAAFVGWAGIGDAQDKFRFDFLGNEMWSGNWLWGYLFTAIAVAMLPLGLLAYERARSGSAGGGGHRRFAIGAAAAGLVAAWFQPWQGATFALVLVAAELLAGRRERRPLLASARDLALPLAATAAPLVYYFVLSQADASWELAGTANDTDAQPRWPVWVTVIGLAPLALPALFAYRLPARDFGQIALRAWPLAALAVFHQPAGTFPFHAFQGLAFPLAVLAVLAVRVHLKERPLPVVPAVAAAALLIVPGTLYNADQMRDAINKGFQAHFMEPGERDALRHLDDVEEPGGVLASAYLGTAVPAYTGRETWTGAGSWTPDFEERSRAANDLFDGRLPRPAAEVLVNRSGARFLFSDCHDRADVRRLLARVTDPPRRFGCATVWRVR